MGKILQNKLKKKEDYRIFCSVWFQFQPQFPKVFGANTNSTLEFRIAGASKRTHKFDILDIHNDIQNSRKNSWIYESSTEAIKCKYQFS